MIAVFLGDQTNALQVRPRIGLGEANTAAQFTGGELGQKVLLLRLRAGTLDTARHNEMGVEDARGRHPDLANPRHDPRIGRGTEPQAAIFFGDRGTKKSELFHLLHQIRGVLVRLIELACDGAQFLFDPLVDGGQNLLFDRRVVTHGVSPENGVRRGCAWE